MTDLTPLTSPLPWLLGFLVGIPMGKIAAMVFINWWEERQEARHRKEAAAANAKARAGGAITLEEFSGIVEQGLSRIANGGKP